MASGSQTSAGVLEISFVTVIVGIVKIAGTVMVNLNFSFCLSFFFLLLYSICCCFCGFDQVFSF